MVNIVRHADQPWHEWRAGVQTRVWSSALSGAEALHMGEQKMAPGGSAPRHTHYYEEHITVYGGTAELWIGDETIQAGAGTTVVVPPGVHHGFKNAGDDTLHIIGASNHPFNETHFDSDPPEVVSRAWEPVTGGARRKLGTISAAPREANET